MVGAGGAGAEAGTNFAKKASELPALVRVVDPKVVVSRNIPVTNAEPSDKVLMS